MGYLARQLKDAIFHSTVFILQNSSCASNAQIFWLIRIYYIWTLKTSVVPCLSQPWLESCWSKLQCKQPSVNQQMSIKKCVNHVENIDTTGCRSQRATEYEELGIARDIRSFVQLYRELSTFLYGNDQMLLDVMCQVVQPLRNRLY